MDLTPGPPLVLVIQDGEEDPISEQQGPFRGREADTECQQQEGEHQRRDHPQGGTQAATPQHPPRQASLHGRAGQDQPALVQERFAKGQPQRIGQHQDGKGEQPAGRHPSKLDQQQQTQGRQGEPEQA